MALTWILSAAVALQPALRASAPAHGCVPRSAAPLCALAAPDGSWSQPAAAQSRNRQEQEQQQQQQQQQGGAWAEASASWARVAAQGALTLAAVLAVAGGEPARAENELADLANSKSTAELVNTQCFADQCKSQMENCAADGDCIKGLACTAKCMGDAQCTVGCFARYDNKQLDSVLQCTIEDAGCIAIATQAPGGDRLEDAPLPPKALVRATPASMSGRWYKVLGFNPNYDCFECQRNSFATSGATPRAQLTARDTAVDISGGTAAVQVEYGMPRVRAGRPTETFHSTLNEQLVFDVANPRRTAHTEGRMFGLTFWENWYVIGENAPREPEFRFVYYTGKTLQNRYEGAFVYARKPELPTASMPSIYKIAREAGLEPTKACCIDNSCFSAPVDAVAQPPLFTPVAQASLLDGVAAPSGGAPTSEGPFASLLRPMRQTVTDISELLENPKPFGDDLFARQRTMTEVREFDANGYRTARSLSGS